MEPAARDATFHVAGRQYYKENKVKADKFEELLVERLMKTKDTLTAKADEYARGDRLSNFKQIGYLMQVTPEKACIGLVSKHIVALFDFVNDLDNGVVQSADRWDEKIGDIMAYMPLLEALVIERIEATGGVTK